MDVHGLDAVVFPANGDVGSARANVDPEASQCAWRNGVKYSNGNREIRHLGVPTISVPMGLMEDTGMAVNLTFAGKGYDDKNLLRYAYAFEEITKSRVLPPLVPQLDSDLIYARSKDSIPSEVQPAMPRLEVTGQAKHVSDEKVRLEIEGYLQLDDCEHLIRLSCHVNGNPVEAKWSASVSSTSSPVKSWWIRS